jgi:SET domain-containing protein
MAFLEKKLLVKKSTLPGAGKGLFTTIDIPKGKRIVEYKGTRTTWAEVEDDDGKNGYIFYITKNNVIDALPHKEALGRYANDARGMSKVDGIRNNAEYIISKGRCYIDAMKDIEAGSEILVSYSADYWKTIKDNIKLEERKTKNKKVKSKKVKSGKKNTGKKSSKKKK